MRSTEEFGPFALEVASVVVLVLANPVACGGAVANKAFDFVPNGRIFAAAHANTLSANNSVNGNATVNTGFNTDSAEFAGASTAEEFPFGRL